VSIAAAPIKTFNQVLVKLLIKEVATNWSNSQHMSPQNAISTWNQIIEKSGTLDAVNNSSPYIPVSASLFGQTPFNSNYINIVS
jgi:hypothetical protein